MTRAERETAARQRHNELVEILTTAVFEVFMHKRIEVVRHQVVTGRAGTPPLPHDLKTTYREFEHEVGDVAAPKGAKTERVHEAVRAFRGDFTLGDLEQACPEVSRDMVRRVLRDLKAAGEVECLGKGPGARWRRGGTTLK